VTLHRKDLDCAFGRALDPDLVDKLPFIPRGPPRTSTQHRQFWNRLTFGVTESRPRKVREPTLARIYRLGSEPSEDLSATTTPAERIEMVALLTHRAWELTGAPWPVLPRAKWPVSIVRRR
jgi:hypothetical protein